MVADSMTSTVLLQFAPYNSVILHSELVDGDVSLCLCVFVTQLGDEVCAPTLGTATSMYKFNR